MDTPKPTAPLDPDALVGVPELCQITGVSRRTIYRFITSGDFPKRTAPRRWRFADVDEWIKRRVASYPDR